MVENSDILYSKRLFRNFLYNECTGTGTYCTPVPHVQFLSYSDSAYICGKDWILHGTCAAINADALNCEPSKRKLLSTPSERLLQRQEPTPLPRAAGSTSGRWPLNDCGFGIEYY